MTDHTFKLFKPQLKAVKSLSSKDKNTLIFLAGRGSGKTVVASHIVLNLISSLEGRGALIAPTYGQVAEIINYLKPLLDSVGIQSRLRTMPPVEWNPSISEFKQTLTVFHESWESCRHIYVLQTKQAEHLRGKSIQWALLDEAALISEDVYNAIIKPAFRGYGKGARYFTGIFTSPRGSGNWVSQKAIDPSDKTVVIRAGSSSNFIDFPKDKIEDLKQEMPDRLFRQEILGEIVTISSNIMVHTPPKIDDSYSKEDSDAIWISADQNVSPMCAGLFYVSGQGDTLNIHQADEIHIEDSAIVSDLAMSILRKIPSGTRKIFLTGDRSGNNRNIVTRKTFYKTLTELLATKGLIVIDRTLKSNPSVFESAEYLCKFAEQGKYTISSKCKHTLKDFQYAVYNSDLTTDKKVWDPHCLDFCRYLIWNFRPNKGGKAIHLSSL